jgi:acetyltransferase-like isoleucine patch superfamily enzyme
MHRLYILLYYAFVAKLPHSRLSRRLSHFRAWYVSRILKIMAFDGNSEFQDHVYIGNGSRVQIGKCCKINEHVFLQGATIGDYVMIAPHVTIFRKSHGNVSTEIPMILQGEVEGAVPVIDDDVRICRNAIIMPGVHIGKGSIVAEGAVVTKDVEPYTVVGGVPARLIRLRK